MKPFEAALLATLPGIRHAFFGRRGGVSEGPFATANMGLRSGDTASHVRENRARAARVLGVPPDRLLTARQVHGAVCAIVEEIWPYEAAPEADALFCDRPGIAIGVTTADCAPVLLLDPVGRRVAAVHAGWRGLLGGVIEATLECFFARGSRPADLVAAVGPCIAQASYEVGPEFECAFIDADPAARCFFRPKAGSDRLLFDLAGCVAHRLRAGGLPASRIEVLQHDTCREEADFFSHRRNKLRGEPRFGVQLSAIMLVPNENEVDP